MYRNLPDIGLALLLVWHIGSVVVWLGSSATFALGVAPSLQKMSVEDRRELFRSFFPRFSRLLGMSAISTVVAGTILFGYIGSVDTSIMPVGWRFIFISIGAVLGLVAAILTLGVALPMANKLSKGPDSSDAFADNPLRKYKYSNLDEASMFRAISGSTRALSVILAIVMTFMVLGVAL